MTSAGIVLVGGRSSRMGTSKAELEWHGSTLLRRTVEVLRRVVDGPVIVVRAPGQPLPFVPQGVTVVADPEPDQGPLIGLVTGLAAAGESATVAFACATDLPFLHPAYIRRVLNALNATDVEVALPRIGGYRQPLAAGYRTVLAPRLAALVATGERRLGALFDHCRVRQLAEADLLADPELAKADPELRSVTNINSPEEYARARAQPAPLVTAWLGDQVRHLRAATMAEAAARLGVSVSDQYGEQPLVAGDEIRLEGGQPGWVNR